MLAYHSYIQYISGIFKICKMFKESDKNPQMDMFSSPAGMLRDSTLKNYLKNDSWHNMFREHVLMRVDEGIFKVLYSSDNGSPNASIRVLVGMMILKEGQGWSDEQLFEECSFNLLVRGALGLMNLTDTPPAASTYYLFHKRVMDYNSENSTNLFKKHDYGTYQTLKSVFEQQFTITPDKSILPLENDKISAKSIQSPHDTDSHYRNKGGNKVKGYSANITETCDDPQDSVAEPGESDKRGLNLITDVNPDVVSTPDCDFLEPSIRETQRLLDDKIEKVYADGAYNSTGNRDYANDNEMDLILTGIQGQSPGYELSLNKKNPDELIVLDTYTETFIKAYSAATGKIDSQTGKPEKRWRIITDDGNYRYFTPENLQTSLLRQNLRDVLIKEKWKRNNVGATIFQLGYGKTRYRGLAANRLWAYSRGGWINFRRILKYVMQASKRSLSSQKELYLSIKKWICFENNVNEIINNYLNKSHLKYLIFSTY